MNLLVRHILQLEQIYTSLPLSALPTFNFQIDAAIQTASVQLQFRQFRQLN